MLTHRNPPLVITENLHSILALLCLQAKILELHNADYCRKYRGKVRIIAETGVAYESALRIIWSQIYCNETLRKEVPLTTFATAMRKDKGLQLIVLSYSEEGLSSISEDTVSDISPY